MRDLMEIDLNKVPSAALRQLIEEVRNERPENQPQMYDRVHNRHNRGNGGGSRRPYPYDPPPEPAPDPTPEERKNGN